MSRGTRVSLPFRPARMPRTGLSPSMAGHSRPFCYASVRNEPPTRGSGETPQPPDGNACRLDTIRVWAVARSLAATWAISVDFCYLRVLRCFTSPRVASGAYGLSAGSLPMTARGLPHSEIFGSTPACGSPKLIAACHVLHRRSKPRHPPTALGSLTTLKRTLGETHAVVKERTRRPPRAISDGASGRAKTGATLNAPRPLMSITVDLSGIEPLTSCVQSRRSPS